MEDEPWARRHDTLRHILSRLPQLPGGNQGEQINDLGQDHYNIYRLRGFDARVAACNTLFSGSFHAFSISGAGDTAQDRSAAAGAS